MVTQRKINGAWWWVYVASTGEAVCPRATLMELIDELHAIGVMP